MRRWLRRLLRRWADRLLPFEEPPARYPLPPYYVQREGE